MRRRRGPPRASTPEGLRQPRWSGAAACRPQETCNPSKGWAKAPLALIIGLVVLVAAFFLVYAPVLLRCRNTPGTCG
ncbi:DUF6480 family protein [Streptomyces sp. NPDC056721]|uniref:DUF6480 family protein n=1 Tax=Streptomyces sp. NPDC056721 TaxID=3345923 RepID=UPI00369BBB3E